MTFESIFGDFTPAIIGPHRLPIIEYPHSSSMVARALVNSTITNFGTTGFASPTFQGYSSIAGVVYHGESYPEEFHDVYFHADYNDLGWVKTLKFDNNGDPESMQPFMTGEDYSYPTSMAINPVDGNIYYTRFKFSQPVIRQLRKIVYSPVVGNKPVTVIQTDKIYGSAPLTVNFFGNLSTHIENDIVSSVWDFGDGSPTNSNIDASHVFNSVNNEFYDVKLTLTDAQGNIDSAKVAIFINNTPPVILSTSVDTVHNLIQTPTALPLSAEVLDFESPNCELDFKWQLELVHNEHSHSNAIVYDSIGVVNLLATPQDNNIYYYKLTLTVTDVQGLQSQFVRTIFYPLNDNVSSQVPEPPSGLELKVK